MNNMNNMNNTNNINNTTPGRDHMYFQTLQCSASRRAHFCTNRLPYAAAHALRWRKGNATAHA